MRKLTRIALMARTSRTALAQGNGIADAPFAPEETREFVLDRSDLFGNRRYYIRQFHVS